jgi:BMFP domain-containing protein YqiC
VPYVLQLQAQRTAVEFDRMREMMLDILNENEDLLQRVANLERQSRNNEDLSS